VDVRPVPALLLDRTYRPLTKHGIRQRRGGPPWTSSLTPRERRQLNARYRAGWKPRALALAYGISIRSVYRHLDEGDHEELQVGSWRATFLVPFDGGPPRQIERWRRVRERVA
jgi:hypothetical protein